MDFLKYINTAKTYSEASPLVTRIKMTEGRLTGGFLYFPSGPAGVLHFQAKIGIHQILPITPGESYRLDDCIVPLHLHIGLLQAPYIVDCVTWNDSALYSHALTVCFQLSMQTEDLLPVSDLKRLLKND